MRGAGAARLLVGAGACALAATLAACAGLPPWQAPVALATNAPLDLAAPAGGGASVDWPDAQWWRAYGDPTLDQLVKLALEKSPTLDSARRRFDSARQSVRLAGAETGVRVEASGDGDRQRLSDNGLFPPRLLGFNWYNQFDLGLQASYTFDWWGKQRDTIEAALDQARAAAADRSAAALVLASSVAQTYFGWQADQARLALSEQRARLLEESAAITRARVGADLESPESSRRDDAALAALRAQEESLRGSAALRVVTLAALVGCAPSALPPLTAKPLPPVSAGLPANVKLDLIARRADVTASRWRVESAERVSDAARAQFYPDVSVNALAGLSSLDLGKLLEYSSRVPQIGAAVHLPIFDSGRLKARYGASRAALQAAVAAYDETVVGAAREVAAAATSLDEVAAERTQRAAAVAAAQALEESAAARVRQGLSDPRPQYAATDALLAQRDGLLQLDAAAVAADVDLKRALGGGYRLDATAGAAAGSRAAEASLSATRTSQAKP